MKNRLHKITYIDRRTAKLETELVHASRFLYWAYNTRLGMAATELLLRHKWISWLYGWWHSLRWSRGKIKPFVERMQVNMEEVLKTTDEFTCFNDFFIREINLSRRSIASDAETCIASVDGKVVAYPEVRGDQTFPIKRHLFDLRELLRSDALLAQFDGGSLVVSRLHLSDYHHFHFPDSGVPGPAKPIHGVYYASGPYALRRLIPFYSENYRMLTLFNSDHFGTMAIVEIGSFTVGSIHQKYQVGIRVDKGGHKGYFELGGSTFVLLFQKGAIELDADLVQNTHREIETYVRMGESIGRAYHSRQSLSNN